MWVFTFSVIVAKEMCNIDSYNSVLIWWLLPLFSASGDGLNCFTKRLLMCTNNGILTNVISVWCCHLGSLSSKITLILGGGWKSSSVCQQQLTKLWRLQHTRDLQWGMVVSWGHTAGHWNRCVCVCVVPYMRSVSSFIHVY